tara:strand:- start:1061 stop:1894 length:834 start_codon:yes stop_codon:yes gene_type:complete
MSDEPTLIIDHPAFKAGFTAVPNTIFGHKDMSPGAKLTFITLLHYAWQQSSCFPGQQRLADDMGVTVRSVHTYLKQLSDIGLVQIKRRGAAATNVYHLTIPDGSANTSAKKQEPAVRQQPLANGSENLADKEEAGSLRTSGTNVPSVAKRKRGRELDDLAIALFEGVGENPYARRTQKEWARFWTMYKQISGAEGTAAEVAERVQNYRLRFPNASLTIPALASHWGECATGPPKSEPAGYASMREYLAKKGNGDGRERVGRADQEASRQLAPRTATD